MSKWIVYIVRCADDTLYTGITTDLERRVECHNAGQGAKYTRSRRPVVLVWQRKAKNESAARRREAKLKSLDKEEKEMLVEEETTG